MSKRSRYKFEIENGTSDVTVVITKKRKISKENSFGDSHGNKSFTCPNCGYKSFECRKCGEMFATAHGVQTHEGMKHKTKRKVTKKRKLQILKANQKYNLSEKGKVRSKKYEKSDKGRKRKQRYEKSTKGQWTRRRNVGKRQLKKLEERTKKKEEQKERWRLNQIEREKEEERNLCFLLQVYPTEQRPYELGEAIFDQRKRWEKLYGTEGFYTEINQHARKYEEEYLKRKAKDNGVILDPNLSYFVIQ